MEIEDIYIDNHLREYLISLSFNMTGNIDDAKDIVQEVYIKFSSLKKDIDNVGGYLKRMVINRSIDFLSNSTQLIDLKSNIQLATPLEDEFWSFNETKEKTLDMAASLLFSKLTPYERAIFVLREVYSTKYDEIAEIIGESESYCRKIYSRLKLKFSNISDKENDQQPISEATIKQFVQNIEENNLEGLKALFIKDIKYYVDGGGRIKGAARKMIKGNDKVAQFILSRLEKITPDNTHYEVKYLNGSLSLVNLHEKNSRLTIHFTTIQNKIGCIYIVADPQKLKHLNT